ncbi:hypothetical protein [Couchioplanes caeruleus]|uniref:FG-GAP repeat protein n=1 Tax=Couchioplanes caeruleus subsp. caeruleus TaxID=56427 RepID=A0A1K0FLM2_9ACTN|nr:hypothetical protein [Couchioplanes caeruleus]OJF13705.1 hypothetical protein BG844_13635 [Couchioplanes caeruleus subsp. caeruleus]
MAAAGRVALAGDANTVAAFRRAGQYQVGPDLKLTGFAQIVSGRFDGDNHDDLLAMPSRENTSLRGKARLYPGTATAAVLRSPGTLAGVDLSDAVGVAAGEFTGDGKDDLAVQWRAGSLFVYPGNRDNRLQGSTPASLVPTSAIRS